jgi:hypothetical protein
LEHRSLRKRSRPARLAVAVVACAGVLLGSADLAPAAPRTAALVQPGGDGLTRALAAGRISRAEYALQRAIALVDLSRVRSRFGDVDRPHPRDATLVLRDLRARLGDLPARDRATAERLLARPTDGSADPFRTGYTVSPRYFRRSCTTRFCVHWVTRSADAPSLIDRNRNRIPDWIDRVKPVLGTVWSTEVGRFGYRRPLSDLTSSRHRGGNPNGKLDVFIADVGSDGLYGYCASDDPRRGRQLSAFCVLDDDYSAAQFREGAQGNAALKVTTAHEFFHAVQFAYDAYEDPWLMEATATWIEDEVFSAINDNVQFLSTSPVGMSPWRPLDYFTPNGRHHYGVWIFFRYLSERFGRAIVRDIWVGAAERNLYSVRALVREITARGADFGSVFADFGAANAQPRVYYREGWRYPAATSSETVALPAGHVRTVSRSVPMYHFSNDYYTFVPNSVDAGLAVTVNAPGGFTAAHASALVFYKDVAAATAVRAAYDASTEQLVFPRLDFGSNQVVKVVLVLTNPSIRMLRCWSDATPPWYACRGTAADDVRYAYAVRTVE